MLPAAKRISGTLEWLLACPAVTGLSALTADIHACGMIDIGDHLPRAIATAVKEHACQIPFRSVPPPNHELIARMYSTRVKGKRMAILNGIAVMEGRLSPGVGIAEMHRCAVLHLAKQFPETIVNAAPGLNMGELINSPIFGRSVYPIVSAELDDDGLTLWFKTPPPLVPLAKIAARLMVYTGSSVSISPGLSGTPKTNSSSPTPRTSATRASTSIVTF